MINFYSYYCLSGQILRSAMLIIVFSTTGILLHPCFGQTNIYVSGSGNDKNNGTLKHPVQHLAAALSKASGYRNKDVVIVLRAGIYPQQKTIEINSAHFKERSLNISSYPGEKAVITGSVK